MSLQAKRLIKRNRHLSINGNNPLLTEVRPLVFKLQEIPNTTITPHRRDREECSAKEIKYSQAAIEIISRRERFVSLLIKTITGSQRIDIRTKDPEQVIQLCDYHNQLMLARIVV
jgi:hypothetical protein